MPPGDEDIESQLEITSEDDHELAEEIAENLGYPFQNVIPKPAPLDTDSAANESTPEDEQEGEREEAGVDEGESEGDEPRQEEELQPKARAGFTKKLGKLQTKIRELEEGLRTHSEKSKAFDHLFNAPDPAAAVLALKESMGIRGTPPGEQSGHPPQNIDGLITRIPKDLVEKFEAPKDVVELVLHVIQQGLLPQLVPYQRAVEQYVMAQAKTEEQTVASQYPTATKYLGAAKVYARDHNTSLEDAILVVSKGKVVLEKTRTERQAKTRNGAQLDLANVPGKRVIQRQLEADEDGSEDQLAAELLEIDRKTGTNRYLPNRLMRRQR